MDYTPFSPGGVGQKPNYSLPELPPPHEPFTHKFLGIILIVAALAGGIAYGIWWWANEQSNMAVAPTVSANPTAGWLTYRSNELQFKYPAVLSLDSQKTNYPDGNFTDIHLSTQIEGPDCPGFVGLEIQVGNKYTGTFDHFVKSQIFSSAPKPGLNQSGKLTPMIVGGHSAYEIEHGGWDTECPGPGYFVKIDNSKYVYIFTGRPESDQEDQRIIDQILSTFKFTAPVDTSSWKTYSNSKYSYSIKYPLAWNFDPNSVNSDFILTGEGYSGCCGPVQISGSPRFAAGTWFLSPKADANLDALGRLVFEVEKPEAASLVSLDNFFKEFANSFPNIKEDLTINGMPAMRLTGTGPTQTDDGAPFGTYTFGQTVIKGTDKIYLFTYFRQDLYEDVINTFKGK